MKNILTVGCEIPGLEKNFISFNSDQSILDADIVVFQPVLHDYESDINKPYFLGKKRLNERSSFNLLNDIKHWKKEIADLLKEEKIIFVIFSKYEEMYIYKTLRKIDNYSFLPKRLPTLVPKSGIRIKPAGNPIFSVFWKEFKDYLVYESYIDGKISSPIFLTKNGNKPVGGVFEISNGTIILLPFIKYDIAEFHTIEEGEWVWNKEGIAFGKRLSKSLLDISNIITSKNSRTPPPKWMYSNCYEFETEIEAKKEVSKLQEKITELNEKKEKLDEMIDVEHFFKGILYEKGKALELSIIKTLELLGYKAENYDDGINEFDHIIVSPEGQRFLGEAEGKDNAAVKIDKFRQLESNIQEDFSREEVNEPAIGILFANGYRLETPSKRNEQFTEKCIKNAKRLGVILIRTMDIFSIIKYLKSNDDEIFKKACRDAIFNSRGKIVDFPKVPK